ncbi:sugar ABC transporter substrate-binding protein [Candidatus Magnetomorum sp. HK-1]|nr:sugar ABC transporter substrate-binding protein [Candidatus Magnetomorum sp. HK-1]
MIIKQTGIHMKARFQKKGKMIPLVYLIVLLLFSTIASSETNIIVWHAYRGLEKTAFEKVLASYQEKVKQKGIVFTSYEIPYEELSAKISSDIPQKKGPDIFIFAQDRIGGWVQKGNIVEPLDEYIDGKIQNRFIKTTLKALTFRKAIYGLPINYKNIALIYNKALVKKPPSTSDELIAISQSLTNPEKKIHGFAYPFNNFYYHISILNAFGGKLFSENRKPLFTESTTAKSFHLLLKWYKNKNLLSVEPSGKIIKELFNKGRLAMLIDGPWFIGEISPEINYGVDSLPKLSDIDNKPLKPWVTVEGAYISAVSSHKKEAFDFINYLTGIDAAKILSFEGRQLSSVKALYRLPDIKKYPVLLGFRKQLFVSVPMPNFPEMTLLWAPATKALNDVIEGKLTPEAALDLAQKSIK